MSFVVFDIETGPKDLAELKAILPGFDRSSVKHPGEFDPSSVKCGNIGGPTSEKGLAKISEARAKHATEVADFDANIKQAEANYWLEHESRAALSAATGRILAIGYKSEKLTAIDHIEQHSEPELLQRFWANYEKLRKANRSLVGFNSREFDVPYIAQRSIMLGVMVPKTLIQNERYLDRIFIDLRDKWGFGGKPSGSLDLICKACGLNGKPEGVNGSHFHKLYWNLETRQEAIDYLGNDLEETYQLAERILA